MSSIEKWFKEQAVDGVYLVFHRNLLTSMPEEQQISFLNWLQLYREHKKDIPGPYKYRVEAVNEIGHFIEDPYHSVEFETP